AKARTPEAIEEARALRAKEKELTRELAEVEGRVDELLRKIPNLTHPEVPIGGPGKSREIAQGGPSTKRGKNAYGDHVDIMTKAGMLDLAAGVTVAGSGFYFLRGDAVLLEFALIQFAADRARKAGFELYSTPDLARNEILEGTGFVPKGPE